MASTPLSWSPSPLLPKTFSGITNDPSRVSPKRAPVTLVVAQKKAKKTRKVILKEDVVKLGKKGQLLDVKAGYYRNFLLPMGMAQIVTPILLKEEMRMLRWICGKTRKDRIRNIEIQRQVGVAPIDTKIREGRLRWFGHLQRRPTNAPTRKLDSIETVEIRRGEMRVEEERIEAKKKRVKEEAQQLALIFETVGAFKAKRKGGKGKQIFGTVTSQDLVDIIKAQLQRDVDKRMISLPEIRETGEYIAELKLHPEPALLKGPTLSNLIDLSEDAHIYHAMFLSVNASIMSWSVDLVR
ncbi:hypothetical protein Scep_005247 [Stephania cephalantha]|uniref:Large ribosomal subunit protein bL9c n=1 Tax=Stephania cephalantha TaxID=152367 RepID=A0AAP0KVD3_9MAGN